MNNITKRKQALLKLQKEAKIKKISENISNDVNLANIENPDQYADAVFDKLLDSIEIEGLDF